MKTQPALVEKLEALAARGSHPDFSSLLRVPDGLSLTLRNVRLWRDEQRPDTWFLEPLPTSDSESGWVEQIFDFGVGQDVFYRGPLLFISLNGERRVERRDTPHAVEFGNGDERSILDLGHYIGGRRDDGAIVFQSDVVHHPIE